MPRIVPSGGRWGKRALPRAMPDRSSGPVGGLLDGAGRPHSDQPVLLPPERRDGQSRWRLGRCSVAAPTDPAFLRDWAAVGAAGSSTSPMGQDPAALAAAPRRGFQGVAYFWLERTLGT